MANVCDDDFMDVDTEEEVVITRVPILKSVFGNIFKTELRMVTNAEPDNSPFTVGSAKCTVQVTLIPQKVAHERLWVIAKADADANPGLTLGTFASQVLASPQESGVGFEYEPNAFLMIMRKRRNNLHMFDKLKNVSYAMMTTPGTTNGLNTPHKVVEFVQAALNAYPRVVTNIEVITSDSKPSLVDTLVEMWSGISYAEIDLIVAKAQAILPAKKRTEMERTICSSHAKIVSNKKKMEESLALKNTMKQLASDPKIPQLSDFGSLLASKIWAMNVDTGDIVEFTAKEWVDEHCVTHSLVMLGKPKYGKTPAALSLCAELAHILCEEDDDSGEGPYFLTVGTVDSLRKVQGSLRSGTPLCFDDVTPKAPRGTRKAMTIEEVKHLTNVTASESCDGRSNDITIPDNCPRVFTSNASTPSEWCDELPEFVNLKSAAHRLAACSDNALAVFKRVAFMQVSVPLISVAASVAHVDAKKAAHAAKVAARARK